jgi:PAS domain S-box-containing protein
MVRCNYIHDELIKLMYKERTDELIYEKEQHLHNLFPMITQTTPTIIVDILTELYIINPHISEMKTREKTWLTRLVAISEYIPISVSISSANVAHFGFPLLYVNQEFENITGYDRNYILGKNCRFLQPEQPLPYEEMHYKHIQASLKRAEPVCVIVTNIKRDNTPFYNLLSLYPIINSDGELLFVIGIQTPVTTDSTIYNARDIKNIIDLLYVLSDAI